MKSGRDAWAMPFAALMLLLTALFVVLFATSRADADRARQATESLKKAFDAQAKPSADGQELEAPSSAAMLNAEGALREMIAREQESGSLSSDGVDVAMDGRGLIVRLATVDFFQPGQKTVGADLWPLLDRIGGVLARSQGQIIIEGHADPRESSIAKPSENLWELSSSRAAWVAQRWISTQAVSPARVSVAGLADTRPLHREAGEWERASNRRVEIVLRSGN